MKTTPFSMLEIIGKKYVNKYLFPTLLALEIIPYPPKGGYRVIYFQDRIPLTPLEKIPVIFFQH